MKLPYRGNGKIYYKGKEYNCVLYYNEQEGGILLKITVKNENKPGNYLEVPLEMPYLCGQLDSGFKFTLLHLERNGMNELISYGITEYNFYADYILCGIGGEASQEQSFNKVSFNLSNIVAWGEESVYTIGEKHELMGKNEDSRKLIINGSDFSISYKVSGSMLPVVEHDLLAEHIDLEQHGIFDIEFSTEQGLDKFSEIFDKLKRLIEIAVRRRLNLEKVEAYSSEIVYSIGDNTTIERPIDVFGIGIKAESAIERPTNNYQWKWISFSDLIKNNSFELYFKKYEVLAPIVELYLEPMYINASSNTRIFLNIIQALETYHSRFITNSLDRYKERVERIVNGRPNDEGRLKKFLLANSHKFITLESRIADLLFAEGKVCFDTGDIEHIEFPAVIAHSRNYYIHYDETIKEKFKILSEEELQIYNRALLQILEFYILKELGFPIDTIDVMKKLNDRWGKISDDLNILNLSRSKYNS